MPAKGDNPAMVRRTINAPLGELDRYRNRLIGKLRLLGSDLMLLLKEFFWSWKSAGCHSKECLCQNGGHFHHLYVSAMHAEERQII